MTNPSTLHPGLTNDRLQQLAAALVRARRGAFSLHDADAGETNWSLGTRTYERACQEFRVLCEQVEWLKVYEQGFYFLLLVDEVPIKFHRTDPEDPSPRTTRELAPESYAKQVVFAFYETAEQRAAATDSLGFNWRLYYQDDPETREVFRVALARVGQDGKTDQVWDIDLTEAVTTIAPIVDELPEAPDLDRPVVSPREQKRARETSDAG